jgi:hypothetical protein
MWWLKTWMPWSIVVGGIYNPNHQSDRWGGCLSTGALDSPVRHRTLSGAPATSPNRWGSTVGALTSGATGQSGGASDITVHCPVRLLAPALTLRALSAHCSRTIHFCRRSLSLLAVAPHGTPDSPVLHRTVRWIIADWLPKFPKLSSSEWIHPGAPDTVRWCIGQSGTLDQGCLRFLLLLSIWTLSWTFYWFVLNLWHL